jgi:4-phytase / acid phosphatase
MNSRTANVLALIAALSGMSSLWASNVPAHPPLASKAPAVDLKLTRVVMLSRHGVRSPTQGPEELHKLAPRQWPTWSVGPGELTAHGERGERILGGYFRAAYAADGLVSSHGCPSPEAVSVWADNADQRTRVSGQALLDGMFPGCGLKAEYAPLDAPDPLFHPLESGQCPMDAAAAEQSVLRRAAGKLDALGPTYDRALTAVAPILQNPKLLEAHNDIQVKGHELRFEGPLKTAATAVEVFLLEYEEGLPAQQVGWGEAATLENLAVLLPAHNVYSDLLRKDPYIAAHNGTLIAQRVLAALNGQQRLTVLMGHDTNLANLAALISADWELPGQPDSTPPGGTLAFELWRAADGKQSVRTVFYYQTPDQLRELQALNIQHPPGATVVQIPACAQGHDGLCTIEELSSLLDHAEVATCLKH